MTTTDLQTITMEELVLQAHLDDDDEGDVKTLRRCGIAAEQAVFAIIRRTPGGMLRKYGAIPEAVRLAVLMLATHLYEHRTPVEPTNLSIVPYSIDLLLKPYWRLCGGDGEED